MQKPLCFSVFSGDARQIRLAGLLSEDSPNVTLFTADEAESAVSFGDVLVLPVKGLDADFLRELVPENKTVVSGHDFLCREDFAVRNAVPTAEGAIQTAMENTAVTLHGSRCLVIGFGRIGRVLARMLRGIGAEVSVSARRADDMAWLAAEGYPALNTLRLEGALSGFDMIFNTVPANVLPHARLLELGRECLLIDLASPPGGIDKAAAEQLGLGCIHALNLPGRVAPKSAALILRDTLYDILRERGYAI